jgi:hypothetical protein
LQSSLPACLETTNTLRVGPLAFVSLEAAQALARCLVVGVLDGA